jgi:dihydroorotate dehydrogenase (fumarate)
MRRKGFKSVDDFRGMLAIPSDADRDAVERAGYVRAMRAANMGAYVP